MPVLAVYLGITAALSALVVWAGAAGAFDTDGPLASERTAFHRMVWPTFLGALVVAFFTGWALREPDPADERVTLELCVLAGVAGLVLVRAITRAVRGVAQAHETRSIATVGLFACRVVVVAAFRQAASPEILAAAFAHEAAHVRHRDPLRIWLAQIACDLQWPFGNAGKRFERWLLALELRRDEEAVMAGAAPIALAEGILLAARLQGRAYQGAAVGIAGDGSGIALRVRRLLDGCVAPTSSQPESAISLLVVVSTLVAAAVLGASFGDGVLAILPGVAR